MNNNAIYQRIKHIICSIKRNEAAILAILRQTETYKTAKSEIDKSVYCLENIDKQVAYIQGSNLCELCVFLPMNQPLYSLVLFAVIPGCMFDRVFCRPPILLEKVYSNLFSVLDLAEINITCTGITRRNFIKQHVMFANAVIYTGKYENAIEVMQTISPRIVFIFQGSGANPIIITSTAEITDKLIDKVVYAQIYNSGQDCMAPSAIFVSCNNWARFLTYLTEKLGSLVIGGYDDEPADIAPMIEEESFNTVKTIFERNKSSILYGGKTNSKKNLVQPTIIQFSEVNSLPYASCFSPTFCLYCYNNAEDIFNYLSRTECQENKAYVSVFGETNITFGNEIIIKDDILDSVDNGYSEFGGFGRRSGFVSYDSTIISKPILISRELAMYRNIDGVALPIGDLEKPTYETNLVFSNTELKGKRVIEVGCGTVPHARALAPHCETYVAIDTNQMKVAAATNSNALGNLSIEIMNGGDMKYETQTFDVALMFHCLHEARIEEQGIIVKEIHRVLKENGLLFIIDAVSEPTSDFQKLFDIVHEYFFDYKHIYAVKHSEWVVTEYIKRGYFRELKTETHKMVFSFSNINELRDCLLRSFMYEYDWTDASKQKLTELLTGRYKSCTSRLELEEIIHFRILKRETAQGDFNEQ